jgi:RNA-directed DNA polymerase
MYQQAIAQQLIPIFELKFSDNSYGFRPDRNSHQAIKKAKEYINEGYTWVVDIDLEKYFDTVNHDKLTALVAREIKDKRVMKSITVFIKDKLKLKVNKKKSAMGRPWERKFLGFSFYLKQKEIRIRILSQVNKKNKGKDKIHYLKE